MGCVQALIRRDHSRRERRVQGATGEASRGQAGLRSATVGIEIGSRKRLARGLSHFQNVEREAMLQLHAGSAENGTYGAGSPSLFANHLANIFRRDAKTNDCGG